MHSLRYKRTSSEQIQIIHSPIQIIQKRTAKFLPEILAATMKLAIVLALALIAYVSARPAEVTVTRSEKEIKDDGSFNSVLELDDGTVITQSGTIKNPQEPDPEKRILVLTGGYKFTDPASGQVVDIKYTADENGYQPSGDAIPKAP